MEVDATYTGKVTRIFDFGAMVEILPGKEGLVHISELAEYRVGKVADVVKVGDEVTAKVINIDNMGRVNLSLRALFESSDRVSGAGPGHSPRQEGDRFSARRAPSEGRPRYNDASHQRRPNRDLPRRNFR